MKITIKKPQVTKISIGNNTFSYFKIFYSYREFHDKFFPVNINRLIIWVLVSSLISLFTYFLTSYIRAEDVEINQLVKEVAFLNYAIWGAYILFVAGINILMILFIRIKKVLYKEKDFFLNQMFIAAFAYLFMRSVATIIILADELLPFEINFQFRFFNFNLLTLLFVSQIMLIVIAYNYLLLNLPEAIKRHKLFIFIMVVLYLSSIWTLTSP